MTLECKFPCTGITFRQEAPHIHPDLGQVFHLPHLLPCAQLHSDICKGCSVSAHRVGGRKHLLHSLHRRRSTTRLSYIVLCLLLAEFSMNYELLPHSILCRVSPSLFHMVASFFMIELTITFSETGFG